MPLEALSCFRVSGCHNNVLDWWLFGAVVRLPSRSSPRAICCSVTSRNSRRAGPRAVLRRRATWVTSGRGRGGEAMGWCWSVLAAVSRDLAAKMAGGHSRRTRQGAPVLSRPSIPSKAFSSPVAVARTTRGCRRVAGHCERRRVEGEAAPGPPTRLSPSSLPAS